MIRHFINLLSLNRMSVVQQNGKVKGFTQSRMKVRLIVINNFNRAINRN